MRIISYLTPAWSMDCLTGIRGRFGAIKMNCSCSIRFMIRPPGCNYSMQNSFVSSAAAPYITSDETVDMLETPITAGVGIRFYLKQVGGPGKGGRFDFGINLKSVSEGKPLDYVIFAALAFDEMF